MVVEGDGARGEQCPPARHPGPPREIGILEVGEERAVDPGYRVEHLAAEEAEGGAGAEDLDRLGAGCLRAAPEQPLPGDTQLVDLEAGRVDRARPVGELDLRGDRADVAGAGSGSGGEQLGERVGTNEAVVVHEGDPLAARRRDPDAGAPGEPERRIAFDQAQLAGPPPESSAQRRRRIVQDEHELRPALDAGERAVEARQAFLEQRLLAEDDDDRRQAGHTGSGTPGR